MKTHAWCFAVPALAAVGFALLACSSKDPCDFGHCGAGPDGDGGPDVTGDGGGADAPVDAPEGCDPGADPKDAPKCVVSEFGVFVDANGGDDANPGTKEKPTRTVASALGKLGNKQRVYVCEGTYTEHVKLAATASLYGGFSCGAWTYSGAKAKVLPKDAGYALELSNAKDVVIEDMAFEAVAGTTASVSSIAIFAHGSKAKFVRVSATANEGKEGASATLGSNYNPAIQPDDASIAGKNGVGTVGGGQQDCLGLCTNNDKSTGGKGGNGGGAPTSGEAGKPNQGGGAAGLANMSCGGAGIGGDGNPGAPGADGVAATTPGTLTEQGFTPSPGEAGKAGGPGQGGGGGGGATSGANGAGGGGGCGGCGGAAGGLAQGGGASIALLSFDSNLSLSSSSLKSNKAGAGGAGSAGQDGQGGGAGGPNALLGCQGGKGGKGGAGGASAGGAGGISAGILSKGPKVTMESTMTSTGDKGLKGTGGKPGTNDGPDGQKVDALEL